MQTNELTQETLRRLAEMRVEHGCMLTMYVDLDPTEFATAPARATEVRSLVDDAHRRLKERDDLTHDDRRALKEDVARVEGYFADGSFSAKGAHAMAVFSAHTIDFFEVLRLPRSITSRVVIDDSPFVEPLAEMVHPGSWAVLLVNRRVARLLRGTHDRLAEVEDFGKVAVGSLDEGQGTGARSEESVDEEASDHLKRAAAALFENAKHDSIDRLLIACPRDLLSAVEAQLRPALRERLAGHLTVDIEHASVEDVYEAATPAIEEDERRREREALDAVEAGVASGGRGAAGLDEVLAVLNERRVETLLYAEGFSEAGVQCRSCGWIGASAEICPVDGGELEERPSVVESAIELALEQSAAVLVVRHYDDLSRHGGIAAVLRF